jgi:NitT/TauT family transport system substrate-binding protein
MDCSSRLTASIRRCAGLLALLAIGWAGAVRAEDVNVGIIGSVTDAPFFIADAKGYYRDEGLTVHLVQFDSGAKMTAPLAIGELDAGGGAASAGLYNAAAQGIVMKIVADKVQYGTTYNHASLLIRKALVESGRFKGYKDLKGLRIATAAHGSSDESVLNEALKRGGLKWGDAEPVYLGFGQHLPAFVNGAIDASLTPEPLVTTILNSGAAMRFVSNEKFYPKQQSSVLVYGSPFIKNRPATADKFMRAYIRAVRFYNDAVANGSLSGPTGPEVIAILAKYSTVKDAKVYSVITPHSVDPDGKVNLESLWKDWQFFKDTGQIDGKVTPDEVVDGSFAEKAVAALGPYKPAMPK